MLTPEQIAGKTEASHQMALFAWASDKPELRWMLRIGNEDNQSAARGARAKAMGLRRGVADILLPVPAHGLCGLWLELKYGRNKQSPDQIAFADAMRAAGYGYCLAYSWQEAAGIINLWMGKSWGI